MTLESSPWISYHVIFETLLIAWVIWLLYRRKMADRRQRPHRLTTQQEDELIAEWQPEPLVPDTPSDHPALNPKYVDGKMGKYVTVDGKEYLNLATSNFLGLVGNERIEEVAKKTIYKYGVGSCGPRGFYGTVDVHLELEKELAVFMGCEEAVLYSYGFATIASAIPAYAKRGDVIFVDKGVNFAIQKGLQASRSRIEWFNHNDVEDLERLLIIQADKDREDPKKAKTTRRFMVVEGMYMNSADLCPLPQLMDLKWKYKVRIFIDESLSFGVIGDRGRGVTEHYNVDVIDVDMIMASLENAVASTGGFCCGRSFVVGHQRLSGLGYCFSASLPPLLATAAHEALRIINEEPERIARLRKNALIANKELRLQFEDTKFIIQSQPISPMLHVKYDDEDRNLCSTKLDLMVEKAFEHDIALTRARYLQAEEAFPTDPSIRLMINSELTADELHNIIGVIGQIARSID